MKSLDMLDSTGMPFLYAFLGLIYISAIKRQNLKTMKKIFQSISVLLLLVIVFLTYANTVDDLDLWWHLKDGQRIYETHANPQKDEFAFTTYIPESISNIGKTEVNPSELPSEKVKRFLFIALKTSWLGQLGFYVIYLLGGFKGIGIFKSIIFISSYAVLYLTMLKRGAGHFSSLLVLSLIALIGIDFNYTRTQLFSYLLFSCTLYALYDFRKGGKCIYFLPVLMLIWANLHGVFILGVLITIAFAFSEFIKYILNNKFNISGIQPISKRQLQTLILISFASFLLSLLNPNTYKTFLFPWIMKSSVFGTIIEEYRNPMFYEYHAYWFMLALVVVSILICTAKKRMDLNELFLSLILIPPSLTGLKYIIFLHWEQGYF